MSLLILHNCTIGFGIIIVDSMLCMMNRQIDAVWTVQEIHTQATNHEFIISLHNTSNKTIYQNKRSQIIIILMIKRYQSERENLANVQKMDNMQSVRKLMVIIHSVISFQRQLWQLVAELFDTKFLRSLPVSTILFQLSRVRSK